jgi:hypothetical protein
MDADVEVSPLSHEIMESITHVRTITTCSSTSSAQGSFRNTGPGECPVMLGCFTAIW